MRSDPLYVASLLVSPLVAVLVAGCASDNGMLGRASIERAETAPVTVVDAIDIDDWPHLPVVIENARVAGTTLHLDVSYPGGCRVHGFGLIVSRGLVRTTPPRAGVLLAHDDYEDPCDATVNTVLSFDLTPLDISIRQYNPEIEDTLLLQIGEFQVEYVF